MKPTTRHRRSRSVTLAIAFLMAALATTAAIPWFDTALEYRVKAAFLYNFALFTSWPDGTFEKDDSPIIFGVVGKDPFGTILDKAIEGKTLHGRPLVIRRYPLVKDLKDCHILFVSNSEEKGLKEIFKKLADQHVFTVSDMAGFSSSGGLVRFYIDNGRVSFEINTDTAARQRLLISSQLLKLATLVKDKDKENDR